MSKDKVVWIPALTFDRPISDLSTEEIREQYNNAVAIIRQAFIADDTATVAFYTGAQWAAFYEVLSRLEELEKNNVS